MRVSLRQAKNELKDAAGTSGINTNDDSLLDAINRAQREIHKNGSHPDSYAAYSITSSRNFLTLPHEYESIIYARVQDEAAPLRSMWHNFVEHGPKSLTYTGRVDIYDQGYVPLPYSIADGENYYYLRIIGERDESVDSVNLNVNVSYIDEFGNDKYEVVSGVRQDWEAVSLPSASPYEAVISTKMSFINRIFYDRERLGNVKFYRTDNTDIPSSNQAQDKFLGQHEYYQQDPAFRTYMVSGFNDSTDEATNKDFDCIVKKKFIPARLDSDLLFIADLEAIRNMLKAFASDKKDDVQGYLARKQLAKEEINMANKAHHGANTESFIEYRTPGTGGLGHLR